MDTRPIRQMDQHVHGLIDNPSPIQGVWGPRTDAHRAYEGYPFEKYLDPCALRKSLANVCSTYRWVIFHETGHQSAHSMAMLSPKVVTIPYFKLPALVLAPRVHSGAQF